MVQIIVPQMRQVNVRRDGHRIVLLVDGQGIADLPWEMALEVAKALTIQARRVEEEVKHEQIISDSALLIRTGARIGLTNNPAILNEAAKEAVYNTELRRHHPSTSGIEGINSKGIVGRPRLIKHRPKEAIL